MGIMHVRCLMNGDHDMRNHFTGQTDLESGCDGGVVVWWCGAVVVWQKLLESTNWLPVQVYTVLYHTVVTDSGMYCDIIPSYTYSTVQRYRQPHYAVVSQNSTWLACLLADLLTWGAWYCLWLLNCCHGETTTPMCYMLWDDRIW